MPELGEGSERQGPSPDTDWQTASYNDLIKHIITVHHAFLRRELPLLVEFVNKIAEVHGGRHPELVGLRGQFHEMRAELEPHLDVEEYDLFPAIRAFEQSGAREDLARAVKLIEKLEQEHRSVTRQVGELRRMTDGYKLPDDACQTYAITFQKLIALESDVKTHFHLENDILYSRLLNDLKARQQG